MFGDYKLIMNPLLRNGGCVYEELILMAFSPIQPTWVPPNCVFQVDDAEQPWTFKTVSIRLYIATLASFT
jgi:hypothetical protein